MANSLFSPETSMGLPMPRYFFHVRDADDYSPDTEGQELPDLAAAKKEAISANREIMGETLLHGGAIDSREIIIADESGAVLLSLNTDDVLLKDGEYRVFKDDVTQSAPVAHPVSTKSPPDQQ